MSVIPLTIFFSLLLAGLFIGLFAFQQRRRRFGSLERDSLLPLAEEGTHAAAEHDHDHDGHDDAGCGCRSGKRAPCAGCIKFHRHSSPTIS